MDRSLSAAEIVCESLWDAIRRTNAIARATHEVPNGSDAMVFLMDQYEAACADEDAAHEAFNAAADAEGWE